MMMENKRTVIRLNGSLYFAPRAGGSYYRLVPSESFNEGELLYEHEVNERLGIKQYVPTPTAQKEQEVIRTTTTPEPLSPPKEVDDGVSMDDLNDLLDGFN
jgi:hypothetical protein